MTPSLQCNVIACITTAVAAADVLLVLRLKLGNATAAVIAAEAGTVLLNAIDCREQGECSPLNLN